jgi:hypothetical protein
LNRTWRRFGIVLLVAVMLPLAAYEFLQKGSENLGFDRGLWRLSQRAEDSVHWHSPTGIGPVDHALHEWQETGRFLVLATRNARRS